MGIPATSYVELPDLALLRKFDIPAPRYTSYPTADRFTREFGPEDYEAALQSRQDEPLRKALSLYVHIPFCSDVCYYCGCNKIVTRDHARAAQYLEVLGKEMDLVGKFLTGDREIEQLHFGGGSPTFLDNDELERVMTMIRQRFPLQKDGEFSIEADPRSTPADKIAKMAELGLNRMSLGVQDLNAEVQKAVNRIQPFELVRDTMQAARANGFHSINMDLIYGLPLQTEASFARTIEQVIELSPDRIALYHYAHLPNIFKPQRMIRNADLPSTETKVEIMFNAIRTLTANGYRYIGMDHFAKETDELSVAQKNGTLQRNFQGYSTRADCDMVALGASSISKVGRVYACNPRDTESYYAAINGGRLATMRGFRLSDEDELRHWVIMKIMCQFEVKKSEVEEKFGVDFDSHFAWELKHLAAYQKHELVSLHPDRIVVTPKGRIFVRAVAMQFDKYLRESDRAGGYSTIA
ncbi:oxygen-independent coproporphyrinogen III oxidase [Mesosutterella sp. AGMB02718]|uniref:Coproporphyrinogen-III oxidase n=1 Tax=Mesosutterella faecium TaxID=2925194 RepID=A0ABT7IL70_9BURK|nr:oxygen-independent coproporphyrinogen III oxidase [Mesosutterella sp. AGMB02718]MDL2059119.1 oxygen-independent coproporphyrinogen III oxidase [Mesosutterella sp. AGMB02718]